MARVFWPTVPRRLLFQFDQSVRSYVMVLTRVWFSQNSASVLGFTPARKPAGPMDLVLRTRFARTPVKGLEEW
jgi:hypothetical protein